MRSYKDILSVSLLLFAIGWSLWFVFAGFGNHLDPPYWLYKFQTLECGWMAIGTILSGAALVRLFGANLLMLRLAAWGTVAAAIVLPYCTLLTKEQRRSNIHWLALAFAFMNYGAFQEFSSGTLTVLLLSAIWVSAVQRQTTNDKRQILTAILAGLAVTVRFPNILVLLILIPLWRKKSLWLVPIVALSAGLVYIVGYALITPVSMDPAMGSHGIGEMISALWERAYVLLLYLIMWGGTLAIGYYINHKSPRLCRSTEITNYKLPIAAGVLVGALLSCYVSFAIPTWKWYNIDLTYMISAGCLVLSFTNPKFKIINQKFARLCRSIEISNYQLPIGAIILMIATMGTDVAWLKLFPAVLCLLPVAAVQYEDSMRRYLFPVLAIFAVTVMIRFSINSVGSSNLRVSNTPSHIAPYTHIRITDKEETYMRQIIADHDSLTLQYEQPVLAFGADMHLMRAITGCQTALYNEFWSNIFDSVYTAKYQPIIEAEHPIVFCSYSPRFKTKKIYGDRHSRLEEMLRSEGYREIDRSQYKYMIYIPSDY